MRTLWTHDPDTPALAMIDLKTLRITSHSLDCAGKWTAYGRKWLNSLKLPPRNAGVCAN